MGISKCKACKPGKPCRWHRGYSKNNGVPSYSPDATAYRKRKRAMEV